MCDNVQAVDGEEEEEEYVVEAIRGWRYHLRKKCMQYYIKWQNYGENENTWEPENNLNCPTILEEYKNSLKGNQRKYFHLEPKKRLSGFQRNAVFSRCVGADEAQNSYDKHSFYVLITFDDSDYAEEVTLEEYFEYEPMKAMEFVEQRLLWKKKNVKKKKKKKKAMMEADDF